MTVESSRELATSFTEPRPQAREKALGTRLEYEGTERNAEGLGWGTFDYKRGQQNSKPQRASLDIAFIHRFSGITYIFSMRFPDQR